VTFSLVLLCRNIWSIKGNLRIREIETFLCHERTQLEHGTHRAFHKSLYEHEKGACMRLHSQAVPDRKNLERFAFFRFPSQTRHITRNVNTDASIL
jgi:hypothetical protein